MFSSYDKAWASAIAPLVMTLLPAFGVPVTPEIGGAISVLGAMFLTWLVPNKPA